MAAAMQRFGLYSILCRTEQYLISTHGRSQSTNERILRILNVLDLFINYFIIFKKNPIFIVKEINLLFQNICLQVETFVL